MRNIIPVAGAAVVVMSIIFWWVTLPPQLIIALETSDGKSNLTYSCAITRDSADAESQAKAAHRAFEQRLEVIAKQAADKMNAALERQETAGSDTNLIYASYKADVAALIVDLEDEFGCKLSGFY